jgi:L-lactate dehydrogenase complex protein LldE
MKDPASHYSAKPDKVYLFGTCLISSFAPETGLDAIALLEHQGIEVIYPREQTCCGQPAFNSGYTEEALEVAKSQIALFPESYPVIVLSGSCGGMMRKHYLRMAPDDKNIAAFSERVFEFSEFLVHTLHVKLEDQGPELSVTIHTSCAGRREMGIHEAGVSLVKQLSNVTLLEHDYSTECCGFGGTFAVKHADISAAMVQDKTRNLKQSGASAFISTDWGCMLNINGAFEHQKHAMRGRHLASFLRERTLPHAN